MDAVRNPYAPGAGTTPPELAGRDEILEEARVAIERHKLGRPNQGIILSGLRGVGKTVLLNRIRREAAAAGVVAISIEASEALPLPTALLPPLRAALLDLSTREAAKEAARRALRALAGFISAWKVVYQDISLQLDAAPEPGLADSKDLESDLRDLLGRSAEAARANGTAIALFVDELHALPADQIGALLASLHGAAQDHLPLTLIGAGLPQIGGMLGDARSYAERMFTLFDVGPLSGDDAICALAKPAAAEGVAYDPDALTAIVARTQGYPYFLQQWGKHAWLAAGESPISAADVDRATNAAIAELDRGFFRIRLDRITPGQERYLRAMAELGPGPHRSADVARALGQDAAGASPHRDQVIRSGMAWSPRWGYIDFTVPLFDEYLKRTKPIYGPGA